VTSTGVSCASNCILTSAGLSCPRGKVLQNPRRFRGLKVRPRRVRASRRGIVRLRVTCPRGVQVCRVDLRLRRRGKTLARKVVRVNGGRTRTVSLKLKRNARHKLARARSLRVIAVAAARSTAGQRATTRMRIRILAPRRRR
jgi:CxxC motif-containing protein